MCKRLPEYLDRGEIVQASIDRYQLLRGDLSGRRREIRPPWSIGGEERFIELCNRCGECIRVCPTRIIKNGSGGYPAIDFNRDHCTFCGDCVKRCEPKALAFAEDPATPPWSLGVEIDASCLSLNGVVCRSCGDICEERAIRFQLQTGGRSQPQLDLSLCSGCGACVAVCPTHSITILPTVNDSAASSQNREEIANP
ncbi:MAG: ferredoxin-type protein NapF [gamma proteobacterium symbiont of Ctena orbiculata]|nr:MAG: ferredoxin-type protein NapF [gamma proteobacterium symbiont of Ctena orbiculata]PVV11591.1 MAG: ferredoxin-type protein NapF [gamma proteobacterium symbiont of Ctena orbiculata]PVV23399.1 MAG: ferredoxin-type protein NapF [gamma proteobacterium symbiont of Ctena orbiculata]